MSLYAEYLTERTGDHIFETVNGFATYRYLNDGKSVYIIDIFVKPEYRKGRIATVMANHICFEAKEKGATELLGTVNPSAKNSTSGLRVLLAYGMSLLSASQDVIVLRKDL